MQMKFKKFNFFQHLSKFFAKNWKYFSLKTQSQVWDNSLTTETALKLMKNAFY